MIYQRIVNSVKTKKNSFNSEFILPGVVDPSVVLDVMVVAGPVLIVKFKPDSNQLSVHDRQKNKSLWSFDVLVI